MNKSFKDFLCDTLDELTRLLEIDNDGDGKPDFRYHLFILLSVGIEMLGATFDSSAWYESGLSAKRFNAALNHIGSLRKYADKGLYENLRCGMAHVYVPNNKILINTKSEGGTNLEKFKNGAVLIQIEDFFDDFKKACEEIIYSIETENKLKLSEKAFGSFLSVPDPNYNVASGASL